ncbi:alanine racemase [Caldisalinibacter kiritimatiensis]|uniref:Low-specificity D-threonine aldolase n=1 Tax=Caldisalinibacter kiritimatiensis TaxID=1304284 RepID=R1AXG4_9FIRM|nr:alanine racemase [Caldisalinibacter kiritimatiensis]EOD01347.1 low-specificity D-threonine aldolase [Caldisalinibacter kiritimatiensis]
MTYINELDTPCVIIDLNKLNNNIKDMQRFASKNKVTLRPMIKTHKMPQIANMQIKNGAKGITCAKISEAEVMAKAGIKDIFIAYEIVTEDKIKRLLNLSKKVKLSVAVDSKYGVDMLNKYFKKANNNIDVLIEINTGLNRCGLNNLDEIYSLAEHIMNSSNVYIKGIFTHAGNVYGAKDKNEVNDIGKYEGNFIVKIKEYLETKGIKVDTVSTGSTPTAKISGKIKGVNEIRPGNYVFYDAIQHSLGVIDIGSCSLSVLSTVISKPTEKRAVIDAGSKSLGLDKGAHGISKVKGYGIIKKFSDITIERLSEEHGILSLKNSKIKIGDKVEIVPNHACTVVNLFDYAYLTDGEKILDIFRIEARGMVK